MIRIAIFVDGSNLMGSLKNLNLQVYDYNAFYRFIFEEAASEWKLGARVSPAAAVPVSLLRTFWYVVGEMDITDFEAKRESLKYMYENDRQQKKYFTFLAGQANPTASPTKIADEAWKLCYNEMKDYYVFKREQLDSFKRFYNAVRTSADFIDIIECGHWKLDPLRKSVAEKGVDTQLAIDIVTQAPFYDVALVLTGDADLIPAVNYVKRLGKHVATVEFVKGGVMENKSRTFSNRLAAASDFVLKIYEKQLLVKKVATIQKTD
jgi:uncharacterized LabA/DUF88 family protein